MTDREVIELFDRFAKLKAEYHEYTRLIEPYTRDIPTMLEWYDNIRGKVDVRAKTDDEILEEIKKTEMYAQSVKVLGESATLELLKKERNHTPICCYRCVYQQSCEVRKIVPDGMQCGKFIKMTDCRECQWGGLSEEGDKYNEPDCIVCDNGLSDNCGRIVGETNTSYGIDCEDFEEPS